MSRSLPASCKALPRRGLAAVAEKLDVKTGGTKRQLINRLEKRSRNRKGSKTRTAARKTDDDEDDEYYVEKYSMKTKSAPPPLPWRKHAKLAMTPWLHIQEFKRPCAPRGAKVTKIAKGEWGTVWHVDERNGTPAYAMKVQEVDREAEVDRFYIAALQYPVLHAHLDYLGPDFVVPLQDAFRCTWPREGTTMRAVLRMDEFVGNVLSYLNEGNIMSKQLAQQLFGIVGLLDMLGVVHGDLKLDQFLYRPAEGGFQVCLTDFGFAGHWGDPKGLFRNLHPRAPEWYAPTMGWPEPFLGCPSARLDDPAYKLIQRHDWKFINRWQLELNLVSDKIQILDLDGSLTLFERSPVPPEDDAAYRRFVLRMHRSLCKTNKKFLPWAKKRSVYSPTSSLD